MKRPISSLAVLAAGVLLACGAARAQTFTEWQDPSVNEINRAPMRASYFAYETPEKAQAGDPQASDRYL